MEKSITEKRIDEVYELLESCTQREIIAPSIEDENEYVFLNNQLRSRFSEDLCKSISMTWSCNMK